MDGQGVQTRTIKEKDDGIRLDKWFKLYFPNLKFGHLQKLMRSGQVRVDSKRVKGGTRIQTGQKLRIPPLDAEAVSQKKRETPVNTYRLSDSERLMLDNILIYEDDNILAVNKPPGLSVQGGSKQHQHLDGMLAARAKEMGQERPHLVHRLDKETSGVLLLARNENSARKLGKLFKEHNLQKYYWAVCLGKPEHSDGEITAPLSKQKSDYGEHMALNHENGKFAKTYYHVIEQLGKKTCWIVFQPLTGRTHQIRVHASLIECPILGDKKYANPEQQECFTEILPEKTAGLHLHAAQLVLPNPFYNKNPGNKQKRYIDISAPLPEHMARTWKEFDFPEHRINNADYFDNQG